MHKFFHAALLFINCNYEGSLTPLSAQCASRGVQRFCFNAEMSRGIEEFDNSQI